MNLHQTILNAYKYAKERNVERIYWLIDIHDTVAEANYSDNLPRIIPESIPAIIELKKFPETCLILYSSCYPKDHKRYMDYFKDFYMEFDYFNENPEVKNTATGDFSMKIYFNVMIDDKAGFEKSDWENVVESVIIARNLYWGKGSE